MPRTALVGMVALAALLAITMLDLAPPSPRPADTPAGSFSAVRAHEDVKAIARAPHPMGSAEHERVRDHLVARLRASGFDVTVQEGVGVLPIAYDGVTPVARVRNIVAVRRGTAPTGRVVLTAHYDSVDAGPGAADDGAGVATMLEVARALPAPLRNDLVLLITDGEERGLLGAEAFVRDHPLAKGTVVVLNNEARGNRGVVQTFRGSPGLIEVYGRVVPHPSADSAFASLMDLLPNNTDFHVFERAGWLGLDSAFVGGGAYYHSPLDDPAHLDLGSLQQMGDNTLALTRALGAADLPALKSARRSVHFTVPGLLVRYPAWLEPPIALASAALAAALVWALRRRSLVTLPRLVAATGLAVVPVVAAAGAGYAVMPLLGLINPAYGDMYTGDPYRPWLYQAALLVFVAAIVLAWRMIRRPAELAAGAVVLVALLGVASAVLLPGGSHTLAWPAFFAALGRLVALRVRWKVTALTLGLAPATVLLGGTALSSLDVGLGVGGTLSAPHFALLLLLLLAPADVAAPPPARRRPVVTLLPPVTAAAVAVALLGAGTVVDRFDAGHPRQAHLAYAMDADTGEAVWGTRSGQASASSRRFFGEDGWTTRPARPAAVLRPPVVVVRSSGRQMPGTGRTVTLRLTPPDGGAPVIGLSLARPVPMTVDGRRLGERKGFEYHAPPGAVEVTMLLPPGQTRVRAFTHGRDLSLVPGFAPEPATAYMSPQTTAFSDRLL
ncbi:M20/M25/M40 family metallo-hydrolase [Sphaerisporangium fuscum]|uniref:M20/M25/M40 family metallo-hydrolase n=1 Tax=Sphaerisporangium fuscum TaxID=2835868 RepID=UPI001BDDBC42|nr:M20/M25/M40 family metallo-hydrolase [Sphaerisporangium fuscum]